jgi:ketosteroid isomerase-like protein
MQDEWAIEKLIIRYAALNDQARWDDVAALYVSEGRMSRPVAPDDFIEGRDAICAAFKERPPRTTRHICVNILVDVAGDTATATSQILLFTGKESAPMVGGYADLLKRTAQGWRFVERRGSLDFQ